MKRILVFLAIAGLGVGVAATAWAQTSGGGDRAANREARRACVQEARAANPNADRATIRNAARSCLEQAGIVKPLTPDRQARRAKGLSGFEQAKAAHPGDRAAIRQAVKDCVKAG